MIYIVSYDCDGEGTPEFQRNPDLWKDDVWNVVDGRTAVGGETL